MKKLMGWAIVIAGFYIFSEWRSLFWPYVIFMIPYIYETYLTNILQRSDYYTGLFYLVSIASYITALFYDAQNNRIGWLILDLTLIPVGFFRGFYIWFFT